MGGTLLRHLLEFAGRITKLLHLLLIMDEMGRRTPVHAVSPQGSGGSRAGYKELFSFFFFFFFLKALYLEVSM